MSMTAKPDRAAYMREWRRAHPEYVAENRRQLRARHRAQVRLSALFPETFADLLAEELAKEDGR